MVATKTRIVFSLNLNWCYLFDRWRCPSDTCVIECCNINCYCQYQSRTINSVTRCGHMGWIAQGQMWLSSSCDGRRGSSSANPHCSASSPISKCNSRLYLKRKLEAVGLATPKSPFLGEIDGQPAPPFAEICISRELVLLPCLETPVDCVPGLLGKACWIRQSCYIDSGEEFTKTIHVKIANVFIKNCSRRHLG